MTGLPGTFDSPLWILGRRYSFPRLQVFLTLFRMGLFRAAQGSGGGGVWPTLPKICQAYPAMVKLGTVIPYLWKTQKQY